MTEASRICARLGYEFADPGLLERALTHRSAGSANNERLEFLGDALLGFVIAEDLYRRRPDLAEGELSRLRANLVNRDSLAALAHGLEIGELLKLGPGEMKSGGHRRKSILADALEALIGAVFVDGGVDAGINFIRGLFRARLETLPPVEELKDPKTRLQEYLQGRGLALPEYAVVGVTGKAHDQRFEIRCEIDVLGVAVNAIGSSRRKAEQAAAKSVLELLDGI